VRERSCFCGGWCGRRTGSLVGTPKQWLRQFEQQLTEEDWTTVQAGSGRSKPSVDLLIKIANFFQVTTDQLLRDYFEI